MQRNVGDGAEHRDPIGKHSISVSNCSGYAARRHRDTCSGHRFADPGDSVSDSVHRIAATWHRDSHAAEHNPSAGRHTRITRWHQRNSYARKPVAQRPVPNHHESE